MVDLLECTVMPYAWGSHTAIAELTGRPTPTAEPEAELWMGAHAVAPSRVVRGAVRKPLPEVITDDPVGSLGAAVEGAFGPRLPFLLKVLAAAEPLSLQAHPTMEQARAGFAAEDARGVPRDAGHRNYRDASHKPELLCALTPFEALCGFRSRDQSVRLFAELEAAGLRGHEAVLAPLRERSDLRATFQAIMTLDKEEGAALALAVSAACGKARGHGTFAASFAWAHKLAALYPGDVGVVSSLLLNQVHLEPGQAIYLGAGNLHAYLDGVGVEIMASSDNVLRGGLTKKHVDLPELMRVLDFSDGPIPPFAASPVDDVEAVYETPATEFRLSVLRLGGAPVTRDVRGPEILLCTEGSAVVTPDGAGAPVALARGASAFVPAGTRRFVLSGDATVYRATVNLT
ncbi:MAG: Mannose-6-phosphate isomerase [Labilithrix sp.]|nr:Mannose-6-phosphate isomerase [Labilithrix sp.]